MSQDKIKELLAVLDLPENKLHHWLRDKFGGNTNAFVADLAFRMRDRMKNYPNCDEAIVKVWHYYQGKNQTYISKESFWLWIAQPIHWIIAALIAAELAKGEKE